MCCGRSPRFGHAPAFLDEWRPAFYTANAHKWLCAPKGAAFLWVREDRREGLHPLVISHGFARPLRGRSRLHLEFGLPGTADPTAWLAIPKAIEVMGSPSRGLVRNHGSATTVWQSRPGRFSRRFESTCALSGGDAGVDGHRDPAPRVGRSFGRNGSRKLSANSWRVTTWSPAFFPGPTKTRFSCASRPSFTTRSPNTTAWPPSSVGNEIGRRESVLMM